MEELDHRFHTFRFGLEYLFCRVMAFRDSWLEPYSATCQCNFACTYFHFLDTQAISF